MSTNCCRLNMSAFLKCAKAKNSCKTKSFTTLQCDAVGLMNSSFTLHFRICNSKSPHTQHTHTYIHTYGLIHIGVSQMVAHIRPLNSQWLTICCCRCCVVRCWRLQMIRRSTRWLAGWLAYCSYHASVVCNVVVLESG